VTDPLSKQELLELEADERRPVLKLWLRRTLAGIVGRPAREIDAATPLTALGLDSLASVDLGHAVEAGLGVPLPLAELLEGPTLNELSGRLLERLEAAGGTATGDTAAPDTPPAWESPLSTGQQALVYLQDLDPESPTYNLAAAVRVLSPLDPRRFEAACRALAVRHPLLRARTPRDPERGVRTLRVEARLADVESPERPYFERRDATGWDRGRLEHALAEAAEAPFDLDHGPLARFRLWTRDDGPPVAVMALHHVVGDFRSVRVLAEDLARADSGRPLSPAPPGGWTYGDRVRRQAEELAGPEGEALRRAWRGATAGAARELSYPPDHPPPARRSDRAVEGRRLLPAAVLEGVERLARSLEVTPFAVLASAFAVCAGRFALPGHGDDFLLGTPVVGRDEAATAGEVGYFVNPLVLRADLTGGPSFADLARRTAGHVRWLLGHQGLPFPQLVEVLGEDGPSPRIETTFQFHPPEGGALGALALRVDGARLTLPGLDLEAVGFPEAATPSEVLFRCAVVPGEGSGTGPRLLASCLMRADRFDATTAHRWARSFETVLTAAVAAPETPVAELPSSTPVERHLLTHEWSGAGVPAFGETPALTAWLRGPARKRPDAVAVVCDDVHLSHGELRLRAGRLAASLRPVLTPERVVALEMEPSVELVTAVLAVPWAGGAYLPIDPGVPGPRRALFKEDCDAVELAAALRAGADAAPTGPAAPGEITPVETVEPADRLVYVIYTSGSTGRPKGVGVTHGGLGALVAWAARFLEIGSEDRLSQFSGLSFDASVLEMWTALVAGAKLDVAPSSLRKAPWELPDWLLERGTTVSVLPTALGEVAVDPERADWRGASLRWITTGGETLRRRPPPGHPFPLLNVYGPTESTVLATQEVVSTTEEGLPPIGRPLPGVTVRLAGPDGRPLPPGAVGELLLGGAGLARGYLGRPALTAAAFVPGGLPAGAPGARFYRTGDLVRFRADGRLEFFGRRDRQVQVRGHRVELGEVEAVILSTPEAGDAAVLARELLGGLQLVAYVAPRERGEAVDVDALRHRLTRDLPAAMVPSLIVPLDALPTTVNDKVDRKALADLEISAAPSGASHRAPSGEAETTLAAAWQQVLGLDRVGADDNFFEVGGHSLLLPELQRAVERALGRSVPLARLLENPTVAAQARALGVTAEDDDAARRKSRRSSDDRADRRRQTLERQRRAAQRLRRRRETEPP
jgi:amino acid adenylation domain-containing protein